MGLDLILGADALQQPLTGIGRYSYELARQLRHHPEVGRLRYFSLGRWVADPIDALTAQRIEAKDAKIAEQSQQLFAAQLSASQAAQNETLKAYMSGQLAYYNPRPVPAFPVPAPYQYGNCGTCNC